MPLVISISPKLHQHHISLSGYISYEEQKRSHGAGWMEDKKTVGHSRLWGWLATWWNKNHSKPCTKSTWKGPSSVSKIEKNGDNDTTSQKGNSD